MNMQEIYQSVKDFNEIAGTLDDVDKESIALQLDLMQEEYIETVDAFDEDSPIELLDGACDMLVVAMGLLAKLEAQGYDVTNAISKVADNNMSKFLANSPVAPENSKDHYNFTFNEKHKVWVLKNAVGKIMKPASYAPVDLSACVPGAV